MMPADTSSTSVLVCGVMIERCMRFVIEEIQGLYMDTVILLSSGVFSGKNKHKNPNKVRRTCVWNEANTTADQILISSCID